MVFLKTPPATERQGRGHQLRPSRGSAAAIPGEPHRRPTSLPSQKPVSTRAAPSQPLRSELQLISPACKPRIGTEAMGFAVKRSSPKS